MVYKDQINGANPAITHYAGGIVYKKSASAGGCAGCPQPGFHLQFMNHTEGYLEPNGSGGYDYVYQYKDHLGNVRLSYKNIGTPDSPKLQIQEENNYYPFGLKHKGYNGNIVSEYDWKYNNKELDESLGVNWYDYGARRYDASLGRWMNIDPLADKYTRISPYVYVANSPLMAIDPDGRKILFVNGHWSSVYGGLIGSSKRGKEYWGKGFSQAAQEFFNDYSSLNNYNYIDGSSNIGIDSSGSDREQAGYEYAEANYHLLTKGLEDGETIKLVTHSGR